MPAPPRARVPRRRLAWSTPPSTERRAHSARWARAAIGSRARSSGPKAIGASRVYSETHDALGREDEKISNLREKHGLRRTPSALSDVGRAPRKCTEVRARGDKD